MCEKQVNDIDKNNLKYVKLLSRQYPNIAAASTEIINLQAILNLPKGTEHFISDIHGENESFSHVLRNASGVIKGKIEEIFGNSLRNSEKKSLATLIYYPEQKLNIVAKTEPFIDDWYRITLFRLIQICKSVSSKYTRSKVRKALPSDFKYILEELIHEDGDRRNKQEYYNEIIETIISLERANAFIIAISKLIQRLAIDRLHLIGDIYDRGPGAATIMDTLMNYHSVDIQWGNHDITWMGAASGSEACICNVIRISAKYNNLATIEEDYGINLIPLATFAMTAYKDDPCNKFIPKKALDDEQTANEIKLIAQMNKAITIIQFKVEYAIVKRHPEYEMENSLLLHKIDFAKGTIEIDGKQYPLKDTLFPTIDPSSPYQLTLEEKEVLDKLVSSFKNSGKLQEHVRFLFSKGSLYTIYNSNLLYHGCVPMDENRNFKVMMLDGVPYKGRELLDKLERVAREGYFNTTNLVAKQKGMDIMWYLWCGPDSPLYGRDRMTTFERCFIGDVEVCKEGESYYFQWRDEEETCNIILEEFELDPKISHIINGHVPVKVRKGESPIKAKGKLLVIDGGFAKAYQNETGIAGYTLTYNSWGLKLTSHEPFESTSAAIEKETDILSTTVVLEVAIARKRVEDTDIGKDIKYQIEDLKMLLDAYRQGLIKEQE
jgi:fructose-1,6-bisphosphatase-3